MLIDEEDPAKITQAISKLSQKQLSDVQQLIPKIQKSKQTKELRLITAANFEEESEQCGQLFLYDRILEMAEHLGEKFDENINFVAITLRALLDAEYVEKRYKYVDKVNPVYSG